MIKKKCPSCAKKIDKKFNYCPYCGVPFKSINEESDYGLLGRDDFSPKAVRPQPSLPFGMKVIESLAKQLEKQLEGMDFEEAGETPRGFKIRVSTGKPQIRNISPQIKEKKEEMEISDSERERRNKLPRVEAVSRVKRIGDNILYEIETSGVRNKRDVSITELASGLEVRAYSKDKCYVKVIPLRVEVVEYYIEKDKLFLELKG